MISPRLLLSTLALSTAAHGFFGLGPTTRSKSALKPAVEEFAKLQGEKIPLNLQLDITGGDTNGGGAHFPLDGLRIELLQDDAVGNQYVMPGADGEHSALSTGARSLKIMRDASFVGMNGLQYAQLENGCWEMTWREGDPSGALVCGFDVPREMKRNANSPTLPSGRIYINLRLWSERGLERMQQWKARAEKKSSQEMERRHEELRKMQETNNLFMKALHRGNSLAALDRAMATGVEGLVRDVPSDDRLIVLDGGLMLRNDGQIIVNNDSGRSLIGNAVVLPALRP